MVLGGAALKLLALAEAGVVDVQLVVQLGGAVLHVGEPGHPLPGPLQLGVHVVLGDVHALLLHGQALVLAQGHLGAHVDGGGET